MKIKIGAAQVGTCLFDPQATAAKFEDYLGQAKAGGLDLVCLLYTSDAADE